tara:strand:- start:414 stop:593 length:180 start_codon:yes stop_codon:yes gene_type:complete
MNKFNLIEFYQFINPVALAVGIVGFCLWLDIDYLDMGMYGLGLWGVTGALHLDAQKKKN